MWRLIILLTLATVGCGGGGSSRGPAVNQAPVIGIVDNVSLDANSQIGTMVSVSDDRTAVASLVVIADSDDPTLLPEGSITISVDGVALNINIVPALDEVGRAQVEVSVRDDEGLSAISRFEVVVVPVQIAAAQFSRDLSLVPASDEPLLINAVEFIDDAADDDFSDLLQ